MVAIFERVEGGGPIRAVSVISAAGEVIETPGCDLRCAGDVLQQAVMIHDPAAGTVRREWRDVPRLPLGEPVKGGDA